MRSGLLEETVLKRALTEQRASGQRLVSLLVSQALLDPDDGAKVLSEQLGYPAALSRHLELRTAALAKTVAAATCRQWAAVPIARTPDRALIVCARDPSPALHEALVRETGGAVELAVAPAFLIERMIRATCGGAAEKQAPSPAVATGRRPRTISALLSVSPPGAAKPTAAPKPPTPKPPPTPTVKPPPPPPPPKKPAAPTKFAPAATLTRAQQARRDAAIEAAAAAKKNPWGGGTDVGIFAPRAPAWNEAPLPPLPPTDDDEWAPGTQHGLPPPRPPAEPVLAGEFVKVTPASTQAADDEIAPESPPAKPRR